MILKIALKTCKNLITYHQSKVFPVVFHLLILSFKTTERIHESEAFIKGTGTSNFIFFPILLYKCPQLRHQSFPLNNQLRIYGS